MKANNNLGGIIIAAILILSAECSAQWLSQNSGVSATLTDVIMIDTSTAIIVGYGGKILKTMDGGRHWVTKESGTTSDLNAISFRSLLDGYAVGNGVVCHSTDGGETWKTSAITGNYQCIATGGYPLTPAVYIGSYDNGEVRFSYDNGITWYDTVLVNGSKIVSITNLSVLNSTLTKILTPNSIWQTLNGTQWLTNNPPLGFWDDIISADLKGPSQYLLCRSANPGYWPFILKKSPTDSVWKRITNDFPFLTFLNHIQAFSDTSIVYTCGSPAKLFKSIDNGETWFAQNVPTNKFLRSLSFFTPSFGFAVGDSGVILHTENGGLTPVRSENPNLIPSYASLYPNFPNPFNPTTEIRFTLNRSSFVTLKIHNVLGKEVSNIISDWRDPGTYTITWDATGFPSGIYFCRFLADDFSEVQKMILIK
jgi:hypothetical protein